MYSEKKLMRGYEVKYSFSAHKINIKTSLFLYLPHRHFDVVTETIGNQHTRELINAQNTSTTPKTRFAFGNSHLACV